MSALKSRSWLIQSKCALPILAHSSLGWHTFQRAQCTRNALHCAFSLPPPLPPPSPSLSTSAGLHFACKRQSPPTPISDLVKPAHHHTRSVPPTFAALRALIAATQYQLVLVGSASVRAARSLLATPSGCVDQSLEPASKVAKFTTESHHANTYTSPPSASAQISGLSVRMKSLAPGSIIWIMCTSHLMSTSVL